VYTGGGAIHGWNHHEENCSDNQIPTSFSPRKEFTRSMYCCMESSIVMPLIALHVSNLARRTKSKVFGPCLGPERRR